MKRSLFRNNRRTKNGEDRFVVATSRVGFRMFIDVVHPAQYVSSCTLWCEVTQGGPAGSIKQNKKQIRLFFPLRAAFLSVLNCRNLDVMLGDHTCGTSQSLPADLAESVCFNTLHAILESPFF